ncbi:zinc finger protein 740-like isoform X1 [Huso huso]|uniref:Zinc finger protein 740-like isoform X1 n=1 Tax=Huso huso TaxID=61971 RepID=A0ABR0Y2G8_HUSHU
MAHLPGSAVRDHMKWAGLLGCEAVLSSMALMQASTMAGQKKMMSQMSQMSQMSHSSGGGGASHRDSGDRGHSHSHSHNHMVMPATLSCPPLVIRKEGDFHAARILEDKIPQESDEQQQLRKKNRKSGTPCKVVAVDENGDCPLKVQKNFICDHCYGAFRSSYHLKRHILTHTGEKPFACDVCDMRFIQRYHLDRHKRVHSGEKPYQCDRCQQNFSRTDRLLRHRRLCQGSAVKTEAHACCDSRAYSQDQTSPSSGWSPMTQAASGRLAV